VFLKQSSLLFADILGWNAGIMEYCLPVTCLPVGRVGRDEKSKYQPHYSIVPSNFYHAKVHKLL